MPLPPSCFEQRGCTFPFFHKVVLGFGVFVFGGVLTVDFLRGLFFVVECVVIKCGLAILR